MFGVLKSAILGTSCENRGSRRDPRSVDRPKRNEGEYREALTEDERRQVGCLRGRIKRAVHHCLLNTQRRDTAPRKNRFEEGTRHEDRSKHVGEQTEKKRRRKSFNWSRTELKEKRCRNERRDVRVDDR